MGKRIDSELEGISNDNTHSEEFEEVLASVPAWIWRRGLFLITFIAISLIVGSAVYKYPDTISATMTLTSSTPAVPLIAKTTGKIKTLKVNDKQYIKAGDYLAVLENAAKSEDILILKDFVEAVENNIDTLISLPLKNLKLGDLQTLFSSLYTNLIEYRRLKNEQYFNRKALYVKKRLAQYEYSYERMLLQEEISRQQYKLGEKQFYRDSILHQKGVTSNREYDLAIDQILESKLKFESMNSTIANLATQITQLRETLLDIEHQYIERKSSLETKIRMDIAQTLTEIMVWEQTYVLKSPIDGIVSFSKYWQINQNVEMGNEVFIVVPRNNMQLFGKALIPISRSGKVKVGHKVNVRFLNFPDREYGIVKGIVSSISLVPTKGRDEEDNYTIEIKLPQDLKTSYHIKLPYQPEMKASVDIITEDISLLQRLFLPLKQLWTESVT